MEDRLRADRREDDRSNVGCSTSMRRSNRLRAKGLKEGIGCMTMDGNEAIGVDRIDTSCQRKPVWL